MVSISFTLAGQQFQLSDNDVRTIIATHRPGRIHQYWVEIEGTRWPVKQVLAMATGLANRDFQSQSSQRVLAKLDFTIGMGNETIASAPGITRRRRPVQISPDPPPLTTAVDAVLVGCVKSKRPSGAPAKDLYTSDYFTKMRAYAESAGSQWFILSAEHGLVAPDEWLEPYDCYLPKTSTDYRRNWGAKVARQLEEAIGPLQDRVFDVHAGASYAEALEAAVGPKGAVTIDQLKGLPFGQRLSWYRLHASPSADPASEIVAQLSDQSRAKLLCDVLQSAGVGLRSSGLYSWWVDDAGAHDLSLGLKHDIAPGLIYAGLAEPPAEAARPRRTPFGDA